VAAAHLVRERLDDDPLIVGNAVEHLTGLHEPGVHRRRGTRIETASLRRPRGKVRGVETLGRVAAQSPDRQPELPRARGMLALPERDRRGHALRILDQDPIGAHLDDLPRMRAEQEHVAGQALGHELLVERADLQIGLGDEDVVEPVVGNGAAGGQREEPAAPARVQPVVHAVPQDSRRRALHLGGERLGERADDRDERLARELAIRRRVPEARVHRVDRQRLGGDGRDDLLRQHVEGRVGHRDSIEVSLVDRADDRRRLEQLFALGHHDPALRGAAQQVTGTADPLEGRRDVARRLQLHHQVDSPDVDPELERRGCDERAQLAVLQPVLGLEAGAARERAVMGCDATVGDPVVQIAREPLGGAPALREDEGRPVRLDQLGDLLERRFPDGVTRRRQEVVYRRDHLKVEVAREAGVDRDGVGRGGAGQEAASRLDRAHRRRAADPLRAARRVARFDNTLEALERERQMGAALGPHQRVNLVDDQEPGVGERRAESLAREQDEQRLGRRDQHVRGPARHRLPLRGQRVAGAHRHADLRELQPVGGGRGTDAGQGSPEVLLDVVVERAKRRDVDDVDAVLELAV